MSPEVRVEVRAGPGLLFLCRYWMLLETQLVAAKVSVHTYSIWHLEVAR